MAKSKKIKVIISVCIAEVVLLTVVLGVCLAALGIGAAAFVSNYGISEGIFLRTNGGDMVVIDNSPNLILDESLGGELTDGLNTGDRILVVYDGIEDSYPGRMGVYFIFQLEIGDISNVPEDVLEELEALGWSCYDGLHDGNVENGRWFDAEVLDVHEGSISVRGFEGTLEGFYEEITVSCRLKSGETVTGFSEGDVIRITYSGEMAESHPPQIFGVYSIENLSRID